MRIIRTYIFFCFGGMTMNAQHSTENLAIHHKVKDYALWRKGYDEHEKSRLSADITNGKVFRSAEDPNDILILQDVADVAKARTWLGGDDLKTAMQKAGVVGSPSVRFVS
jgi:hypothetical protein